MSSLAPAVLKLSWLFTASFGAYALSLVVLQRTMVPSGGLTRGKARRGACTALRVGQALGLDLKRVLELPQVSERRLPFERLRAISWMVLPDQVSSKPRAVQNALTSRDVCSSHGEFLADVEVVGEKHAPNGSVVARAGPVDAGSPKHPLSGSNTAGTGFGSRRPHRPERGRLPTGERPVGNS